MGSTPTTIFAGTTGPKGDRPGVDSVFGRITYYIVLGILFPLTTLTFLGWLALFVYARLPWWAPAPFAALFWILSFMFDGGPAGAVSHHLSMWGSVLEGVRAPEGFGTWFMNNFWSILVAQIWFALVAGTTFAAISIAWKWMRRPRWEERDLWAGPWLQRRVKHTANQIASGTDSPTNGVTVGIAMDKRDPRFAGGKPGAQYGRRAVLHDDEGAGHSLICGGSGSGKTTTMMVGMRDVIRRGHGLIVVDCKGGPDVPDQVAEWASRYGRDFYHWSMVDKRQGYDGPADGPAFYDPIGRGDPSRRKDLIVGSQRWDVEYYKTVIGDYLQTAFTVIDLVPPPAGTDTLKDIADLLNPPALIRRAGPIPRDRYPALSMALERISGLGDQERSGINNMYARLNTITSSIAGPWLRYDPEGKRDIDLLRAADLGQVVVFSLDSSNYEETSALLAGLIVQDLKTVSSALREEPSATPTHVYIDEFSAVDATNIYGLLSKARDARMPVTLATQALADLKRREAHFDSQVVGIVSSFLIHRANTEEDARIYAGLSGLERRMLHRIGVENTSGTLGTMGASSASGSGFLEEKEMYRVEPGEFQSLKQGECIFIAKIPDERYISPVKVIKESTVLATTGCDAPLNPVHRLREPDQPEDGETFQMDFQHQWTPTAPVPTAPPAEVPSDAPVSPPEASEDPEPSPDTPKRPARPVRPNLGHTGKQAGAPLPLLPGSNVQGDGGSPIRRPQDTRDGSDEWGTL